MSTYSYPISPDWSTEEIIQVTRFFNAVEDAYEVGIPLAVFEERYRAFKEIVTSIGEEKRLGRQFEAETAYSIYRTVQEARRMRADQLPAKTKIKMKGRLT